jgi:hypothetical protein
MPLNLFIFKPKRKTKKQKTPSHQRFDPKFKNKNKKNAQLNLFKTKNHIPTPASTNPDVNFF